MRKNIERIIGLTLCMGMLAGCAQTPESSLVRQKGNKALDSYKEADDKDVNMAGNASSADQTTASESTGTSDTAASTDVHPDNASAARTTIRDLINAPETYKSCLLYTSVLTRSETNRLRIHLRQIDPHAFITIVNSSEIIGKGFRSI